MARAFHEAFAVTSTVVSIVPTRNVRHSKILTNVVEPRLDDPEVMIATIRRLAESNRAPAMVVTCVDWYVEALARHRARIADVAVVPWPTIDRIARVVDKEQFSRLCQELGVPHPRTVVLHGGAEVGEFTLRLPVVAKPGNTSAWRGVSFAGKRKIHHLTSRDQLEWLLHAAGAAGYTEPFIVQEYVPGDDAQMRILTTFSDERGDVVWAYGGQVLLEEHTAGTLGNAAAILTGPLPRLEADARKLLGALGWTGFANFDIKVDPRDGVGYFFELNPRPGRSNYYLTASGINPAVYWVGEHLRGGVFPEVNAARILYRIVPAVLLRRYVRDRWVRCLMRRVERVAQPLKYPADRAYRRAAWVLLAELNQFRKFAKNYSVRAAAAAYGAGERRAGAG